MPKRKTTKPKRSKAGRPTVFQPIFVDQVYKLALLGKTDEELADFFGVVQQTLNGWKKKYPQFLESLKKGKDLADAEVATSLYQRACGYEREALHFFSYEGQSWSEKYIKWYPPDPTAIAIWLNNRQPSRWRRNPTEAKVPSQVNISVTYASAPTPRPEDTPEQFRAIERELDDGLH